MKLKTFWVARDKFKPSKYCEYGIFQGEPFWDECSGYRSLRCEQNLSNDFIAIFFGLKLKPGQRKKFKLVEVK